MVTAGETETIKEVAAPALLTECQMYGEEGVPKYQSSAFFEALREAFSAPDNIDKIERVLDTLPEQVQRILNGLLEKITRNTAYDSVDFVQTLATNVTGERIQTAADVAQAEVTVHNKQGAVLNTASARLEDMLSDSIWAVPVELLESTQHDELFTIQHESGGQVLISAGNLDDREQAVLRRILDVQGQDGNADFQTIAPFILRDIQGKIDNRRIDPAEKGFKEKIAPILAYVSDEERNQFIEKQGWSTEKHRPNSIEIPAVNKDTALEFSKSYLRLYPGAFEKLGEEFWRVLYESRTTEADFPLTEALVKQWLSISDTEMPTHLLAKEALTYMRNCMDAGRVDPSKLTERQKKDIQTCLAYLGEEESELKNSFSQPPLALSAAKKSETEDFNGLWNACNRILQSGKYTVSLKDYSQDSQPMAVANLMKEWMVAQQACRIEQENRAFKKNFENLDASRQQVVKEFEGETTITSLTGRRIQLDSNWPVGSADNRVQDAILQKNAKKNFNIIVQGLKERPDVCHPDIFVTAEGKLVVSGYGEDGSDAKVVIDEHNLDQLPVAISKLQSLKNDTSRGKPGTFKRTIPHKILIRLQKEVEKDMPIPEDKKTGYCRVEAPSQRKDKNKQKGPSEALSRAGEKADWLASFGNEELGYSFKNGHVVWGSGMNNVQSRNYALTDFFNKIKEQYHGNSVPPEICDAYYDMARQIGGGRYMETTDIPHAVMYFKDKRHYADSEVITYRNTDPDHQQFVREVNAQADQTLATMENYLAKKIDETKKQREI